MGGSTTATSSSPANVPLAARIPNMARDELEALALKQLQLLKTLKKTVDDKDKDKDKDKDRENKLKQLVVKYKTQAENLAAKVSEVQYWIMDRYNAA